MDPNPESRNRGEGVDEGSPRVDSNEPQPLDSHADIVVTPSEETSLPSESPSHTPPSIPTPPWLTSPLPSQSGSDQGSNTAVSSNSPPSSSRTTISGQTPGAPYSKYYRPRPMPTALFPTKNTSESATESSRHPSPSLTARVRSMSPPEMDKEEESEEPGLRGHPSTLQTLGPLTCTTLSVHDALMLRCQLHHDPGRLNVLINILKSMADLMMPNHDMVWNLLVVTEGGYNCPFPSCPRHRDGWTRADRTRAHIYADHLMIRYKCDKCNSYFKREQDFNIHVASHDKQPSFECPVCQKTFPKKFNLNRHLRQIHDQRPATKTTGNPMPIASTSTAAATAPTAAVAT